MCVCLVVKKLIINFIAIFKCEFFSKQPHSYIHTLFDNIPNIFLLPYQCT